jgi:UDPglucose 6-dehydrogenase
MKIAIAGYGFVGKAHANAIELEGENDVVISDPKFNNIRVCDVDYDGLIIAVATPPSPDKRCDMTHVFEVLNDAKPDKPIMIKSTISLEGWIDIKAKYPDYIIGFSPEFLREATAQEDFDHQTLVFFGGRGIDFWQNIFYRFQYKHVSAEEAILGKYFRNSYLATKVSFFNQIYDLCEATGINYEAVRAIVAIDDRIGFSHTQIKPERAWGGHCFPKDTNALLFTASLWGTPLTVLEAAVRYNNLLQVSDEPVVKTGT